ncbi:SIR2 family protein [Herminiimonas aquatilis]|uniref:SIR2 family protein n=1 Tax=Herminiimonas aquatilis TaxID=345342 RepID=A0ABW2J4Z8_9BURK
MNGISLDSYIPNQIIKDAALHGELVVFVGAGASMLCGSPDWRSFANLVVNKIEAAGKLNFLEAEQLRSIGDSRRTLSIAIDIAREANITINYDEIFHPEEVKQPGLDLYKLLAELRPVFVTTNYDKWLDFDDVKVSSTEIGNDYSKVAISKPTIRKSYFGPEQITSEKLKERGAVLHLHGSYSEPETMIVSLRDYIKHYADARITTLLTEMFRNYTVLFVGYGLAELEILDHIIRLNESGNKDQPRHFMLYAHRSSEKEQTKFLSQFFQNQCGVGVIPYCIDERGYGELIEVFRSWAPLLDVREPNQIDLLTQIDRYVSVGDAFIQREAALKFIRKRPELIPYFLNSLKDIVWFEDLDKDDYFNISNNPGVTVIEKDGETNYQAEGWPALRYLELISGHASLVHAERIIEIVRNITQDSVARKIDNWRTFWSLATVVSNLPLQAIRLDDIQLIEVWLDTRFQSNMVGHEVGEKLLPRLLESSSIDDWDKAFALTTVLTALHSKKDEE